MPAVPADDEAEPAAHPEGSRRQARERALSLLYEAETKTCTPKEVLAELPVTPAQFTADVVTGVGEHQDEVDGSFGARERVKIRDVHHRVS